MYIYIYIYIYLYIVIYVHSQYSCTMQNMCFNNTIYTCISKLLLYAHVYNSLYYILTYNYCA